MGIYGVGRTKALKYVMQGFRTLEDILERGEPNESQRVGIMLYDVSPFAYDTSNNRTFSKGSQERKLKNILIS
jgi:hypothetical protein